MKYCHKLFHDINFEPKAISPCCEIVGITVPRFAYTPGKPIDTKAYEAHVFATHEALQHNTKTCANCPHLQTVEPFTPEFKINTVSFNHHRHLCNCRCVYCSLWHTLQKPNPILPTLKRLYDDNTLRGRMCFFWGGGEPSITPEFEETSRYIEQRHGIQEINTNAIVYSPAMGKLLHNGTGKIRTSLDSGSSAIYKKVKGVDRFDRVVKNIKTYLSEAQAPFQVLVKYIIFEDNNDLHEIDMFFAVCKTIGVKNIELSLNFEELATRSVSDNTTKACTHFIQQAKAHDMQCELFFVTEYLDRL